MEYQRDLKKMIEQYNNELLRAYQKRQLADTETTPVSSQPAPPAEQTVATLESQQSTATGPSAVETGKMADPSSDSLTYGVPDRMAGLPDVEEDLPVVADYFAPGVPRHPVDFLELEQWGQYDDQAAGYQDEGYIPTAAAPIQTEPGPNPARADQSNQPNQSKQSNQEEIGIGYAQIWVTTRDAVPIPGAHVVISSATRGGEVLQYSASTNVDGLTPIFPLSAVGGGDNANFYGLENEEDMARPYTMYHVSVDAPGYYRLLHQDLPVYAGIKRVQPAEMTPEEERPIWKTPQSEPMMLE